NRGRRGYRPKQAQELATERRHAAHSRRIQPATWALVESLVLKQWSPEQIAGRLKLEKRAKVSHERIYQHIYADKRAGGTLYLSLRCQQTRRQRYGTNSPRGHSPNLVGTETRPRRE